MTESTFRCPHCQAPTAPPAAGEHCRFCGGDLSAPPAAPAEDASEPFILDEPAEEPKTAAPAVPLEDFEVLDLPDAVAAPEPPKEVKEVPVVPVVRSTRPVPVGRVASDPPPPPRPRPELPTIRAPIEDAVPEPAAKPQIILALLVLLGVLVAFVLGLTVIIYAVVVGFKSVAKPKQSAAVSQSAPADPAEQPTDPNAPSAEAPKVPPTKPNPNQKVNPGPSGKSSNIELAPVPRRNRPPSFTPDRVLPITPASLKDEPVTLRFDQPITDTCSGGGGRYFIVLSGAAKQVSIFDVNTAAIVKTIPVPTADVKIAAGMTHLILYSPIDNRFSRYSLITFDREAAVDSPFPGKTLQMAMGAASAGPLLVWTISDRTTDVARIEFVDPRTMKPVDYGTTDRRRTIPARDEMHFRAHPAGTLFASWTSNARREMYSYVIANDRLSEHPGGPTGYANPTCDDVIVTGAGLFDSRCSRLEGDSDPPVNRLRIPAQSGLFYLACPGGGGVPANGGKNDLGKPTKLYMFGLPTPIATIPDLELPATKATWIPGTLPQDKHVHFVPEANLIAVIPRTDDRLVLHRFDPFDAMEKSNLDYLYVRGRPPIAEPGAEYRYALDTKTRSGKVQYKLTSGPEGMIVTSNGLVIWDVPTTRVDDVPVTVVLSKADGSVRNFSFTMSVRRKN